MVALVICFVPLYFFISYNDVLLGSPTEALLEEFQLPENSTIIDRSYETVEGTKPEMSDILFTHENNISAIRSSFIEQCGNLDLARPDKSELGSQPSLICTGDYLGYSVGVLFSEICDVSKECFFALQIRAI